MDLTPHKFKRQLALADLPPVPPYHCRWCGKRVEGKRRNWCGQDCIDEYMIRASPRYASHKVKARDKGVCALCGRDTSLMRKLTLEYRRTLRDLGFPRCDCGPYLKGHVHRFWAADHIVPVCLGGGVAGLDGLRTLCLPCHNEETRKLTSIRKQLRSKA